MNNTGRIIIQPCVFVIMVRRIFRISRFQRFDASVYFFFSLLRKYLKLNSKYGKRCGTFVEKKRRSLFTYFFGRGEFYCSIYYKRYSHTCGVRHYISRLAITFSYRNDIARLLSRENWRDARAAPLPLFLSQPSLTPHGHRDIGVFRIWNSSSGIHSTVIFHYYK